jgi:RNA polymerase sigma-70 factor, ECF subfamily
MEITESEIPADAGETKEFERLVKQNMKRAYFAALMFTGSHDDARDLSQEAFIRAYKAFHKFERSKNFYTWYYRILKNLCLNFIRDRKRVSREDIVELEIPDDSQYSYEQEEMRGKLQEALMELESGQREIILLREFEGLSYKEISDILSIPPGSVMSKLFYARKKLAEKVKGKL